MPLLQAGLSECTRGPLLSQRQPVGDLFPLVRSLGRRLRTDGLAGSSTGAAVAAAAATAASIRVLCSTQLHSIQNAGSGSHGCTDCHAALEAKTRLDKLLSCRLGYPPGPLTGHWGFPPFSNATQCRPGACSADPDWQLPIQAGILEVRSPLPRCCLCQPYRRI